jgi:hypothetical protein
MRTLSLWASRNPLPARILIGISHVAFSAIAVWIGLVLYLYEYAGAVWLIPLIGHTFFLLYLIYPHRKKQLFSLPHSYIRQKTTESLLVLLYGAILALGTHAFVKGLDRDSVSEATFYAHTVALTYTTPEPQWNTREGVWGKMSDRYQSARTLLRYELRTLRQALKKEPADHSLKRDLLILLTILAALGLGYLIVAFSCSLACNGQEGLAWVVLILGWAGVVWLTILAIKEIVRHTSTARYSG